MKQLLFQTLTILFLQATKTSGMRKHNTVRDSPKILILGAGMAGTSAAKRLNDLGYHNFQIIEGADKVGGRLKEFKVGNLTVEMGAQWIHSLGTNPVYELAKKFNLAIRKQDIHDLVVYDATGNDITRKSYPIFAKFDKLTAGLNFTSYKMNQDNKPDTSLRAGLTIAGWLPKTPLEDVVEWLRNDLTESIPPEYISLKFYVDYTYDIHGNDEDFLVVDKRGYSHLVRSTMKEFLPDNDERLILNQVITDVIQNGTHVVVRTKDKNTYVGDYVVVTFSVGMLQNKLVNFQPELPLWKKESIDQFKMGLYYHPFLQFSEVFWNEAEFFLYASSRKGYYPLWQNMDKVHPGSKVLSFTVVGEEARRLDRLTDDQIQLEALEVLRNMYPNKTIPEPVNFLIKRWLSDPLYMGAYSAWPTGYTNDTYKGLCAPIGRIFYAGEACVFHHYGYLQGAFYSGERTAEQLIACNKDINECEEYVTLYSARGCRYNQASNFNANAKEDDGSCVFSTKYTSSSVTGRQSFFYCVFVHYSFSIFFFKLLQYF